MIFRNDLLEIEAIEKLPLVPIEPPHHRSLPPMSASQRPNHCSSKNSNDFCNKIGPERRLVRRSDMSAIGGKPEVPDARAT